MLIANKDHNNIIQVYSVTIMTHVMALDAGQSSQGTFEPITPVFHHMIPTCSLVAAGGSGFWSTYNVLWLILVDGNPLIINPIDDTASSLSKFCYWQNSKWPPQNLILLISPLIVYINT